MRDSNDDEAVSPRSDPLAVFMTRGKRAGCTVRSAILWWRLRGEEEWTSMVELPGGREKGKKPVGQEGPRLYLAGEGTARACLISPPPQEDLNLHCYVACCEVASAGGSAALLPPPERRPGAEPGGVWVGGDACPAGGRASGFLPVLDLGITLLHQERC